MGDSSDFSFGAMASSFDDHISHSIRGYKDLRSDCVSFSQYFIQPNTKVLDIGCSSGEFLRSVRDHNQKRYASTEYLGLDKTSMSRIKKLKTRWACIFKNYPTIAMTEKNMWLLADDDD